jgi:hypothetical protein
MAGPELRVSVGGAVKGVSDVYVAVGGTYRRVAEASTAVGGTYKTAFSPGITLNHWRVLPVSGNPFRWKLDLDIADNARSAVVYGDWQPAPLAQLSADTDTSLRWLSERGPGQPKKTYNAWVVVTDEFGRTSTLPNISFTPPLPAAPPTPTFSNIGENSFTASIPAQVEADAYVWARVTPGYAEYTLPTSHTWTGATPSTRYGIQVLTVVEGVRGAWSPVGYLTTKAPSYTKGDYVLWPSGGTSYNPGYTSYSYYWRPPSEGLRAGNSTPWTGTENRGNQSGFIYYNFWDSTHHALREALNRGATITRVQLHLQRRSTSHGYGGVDPRSGLQLHTHGYESQPGGRPGFISTWGSPHGWSRGEARWVDLPTWFGYHIVRGDAGGRGIALGGYYSPYYLFEPVGVGATGRVVITIT